jgi:hypothetical protein
MLEINNEEKQIVELLRALSSESEERIYNMLLALMKYALMQTTDNKQITIPMFGDFFIKYKGDKVIDDKLEADLDCYFTPSAMLKRAIGQYEDVKKGKLSMVDMDIIKYHKLNIERVVKSKLE